MVCSASDLGGFSDLGGAGATTLSITVSNIITAVVTAMTPIMGLSSTYFAFSDVGVGPTIGMPSDPGG
jgi:hypothetical protein